MVAGVVVVRPSLRLVGPIRRLVGLGDPIHRLVGRVGPILAGLVVLVGLPILGERVGPMGSVVVHPSRLEGRPSLRRLDKCTCVSAHHIETRLGYLTA